MKSFDYVIKDSLGIHARPAGLLVKEAKKYESKISITKDGKEVDASKLMALMALAVKCGNSVTVICSGTDEEEAYEGMKKFFEENL
ncbi:MAG TPA: HPr family phosphocarrier protein [Lachnospiraceae bacterium]|nr:HPr family phosphocarrier protein [Lachnospiraceae bacterium]